MPQPRSPRRQPRHIPPKGRRAAARPAYAAIDLGTNNCRMLVAEPVGNMGDFRVVDSFSRIVRLGEGIHSRGGLDEGAVERTVAALKICAGKINHRGAVTTRAVATEACRRADNCQGFFNQVEGETGIRLETISAEEEAGLTLAGCLPLMDPNAHHTLLFDIGGGSTEVVWVDHAGAAGNTPSQTQLRPKAFLSLPIGVVTVAERFGDTGVLSDAACAAIFDEVDGALAPFDAAHGISETVNAGGVQMIGTSGTVTSLGGIYLGLDQYDRTRVDGLEMDFDAIFAVSEKLKGMDLETRTQHPCIGRGRADLTLPGCAILAAILKRWPVGRLKAADRGIREGLLTAMITADTGASRTGAAG